MYLQIDNKSILVSYYRNEEYIYQNLRNILVFNIKIYIKFPFVSKPFRGLIVFNYLRLNYFEKFLGVDVFCLERRSHNYRSFRQFTNVSFSRKSFFLLIYIRCLEYSWKLDDCI